MSYTLAQMEKVTGASRRAIQFWTDRGVLKPEKGTKQAGRGVHRRYSRDEAFIACIISALAEQKMAVTELFKISVTIRLNLKSGALTLEDALEGPKRVWVFQPKKGDWFVYPAILEDSGTVEFPLESRRGLFVDVDSQIERMR
jgi:hypothetical protein